MLYLSTLDSWGNFVVYSVVNFSCQSLPEGFLRNVCQKIEADPENLLAAVFVAFILATVKIWWRALTGVFDLIVAKASSVLSAGSRLEHARRSVAAGSSGPWLYERITRPADYSLRIESAKTNLPVIVCANLKGGVGKTTLAANIAASFAARFSEQNTNSKAVLAIDLDYQGSLSSMMCSGTRWQPVPGDLSKASKAILGDKDVDWLMSQAGPATWVRNPDTTQSQIVQIPSLRALPAFHDLAEVEDRIRLLWAIAEEKRDIRYFLYNMIHQEEFYKNFSMVVIDAPPRLTTSCIQALTAATHVIIPTVLDDLSADAVGYFGKQLIRHERLWPNLRVLGVVGSMVLGQTQEQPALKTAGDALRHSLQGCATKLNALEKHNIDLEFPLDVAIRRRAPLARAAGKGIAYASLPNDEQSKEVRSQFDRLVDEMQRRMQV